MHERMSVVQQVINDARKLATRLTENGSTVDNLLSQTQNVFKQVECMNEYCDQVNGLPDTVNVPPRNALIHTLQQENRYFKELQKENEELRQALEEHQNIMELIMSKHRTQVSKLISINGTSVSCHHSEDERKLAIQLEKINEMAAVMRKSADLQDASSGEQQALIASLIYENRGLREILKIAVKSGSINPHVDAHTQTEIEPNTTEANKS